MESFAPIPNLFIDERHVVRQAAIFNLAQDIRGEARIVGRAFGIGASALAEAVEVIREHLGPQPA